MIGNAFDSLPGFILLLWLVMFGLWIWSLVAILRRPEWQWQRSGQQKVLYVLLTIFLGLLGSLLYVVIARPKLEAVSAAGGQVGAPGPYAPGR